MVNRAKSIQNAIDRGLSPEQISQGLVKFGMEPLNVNETQRIRQGMELGGNIVKDILIDNPLHSLKSFATGLNTVGAMATRAMTDRNFRENLLSSTRNWAKSRGPLGVTEDIYNTVIGGPFNLETRDWDKIKSPLDVAERVIVGAVNNPLEGLSLALPAAKATGITRALPKAGDVLEAVNAPKVIRQFVPSTNVARVNQQINSARGILTSRAQDMAQEFKDVVQQGEGNIAQAIRNVSTGEWKGNADTIQTTKRLLEIQKKYNDELISLGADPNAERSTAVAQAIVERLNPTRTNPNIYVDNVRRGLMGDKSALDAMGVNRSDLNRLAGEANLAFTQGTLRPISHRFSYSRPTGKQPSLVSDTGLLTPRTYGWATPEELVNTAPRAYEELASQIMNAQTGRVALNDIVRNVGRKINPNDIDKIAPDEVVVSPRYFKELMRQDFAAGKRGTTSDRVAELMSGGPIDTTTYGDNLFAIKREYLEPLYNSVSLSRTARPLQALDASWKFNALLSPQYIMGNRIGNATLNAIEGVTVNDYTDVLRAVSRSGKELYKGELYDYIPKRLKAETSYQGVLGTEFAGQRAPEAFRRALADTKNAIANKDGWKVLSGVNRTLGSPIIAIESGLEFTDRAANFVRQAKRLAATTGDDVKDILSRADSNVELFDRLNGMVKNSLGDYTGRNWAINNTFYNTMSTLFPFFKYPTQSTRAMANAMINRPLGFWGVGLAPSRYGQEMWKRQVNQFGVGQDEMGGVFYGQPQGVGPYAPRMLQQYISNPLTAASELIYNAVSRPSELNITPLATLGNAINFRDNYGNAASSPYYINYGSQTYRLDENGNPTGQVMDRPTTGDVARNVGATLANMYIAPLTAYNRWIGPMSAQVLGKDWYPRYSTSLMGQIGNANRLRNFFISGKSDRRGRQGEEAFTGSLLGNRYIQVYPKREYVTPRELRGVIRKFNRLRGSR